MKALPAALLVMGLVVLAASSGIASAVSFDVNYSDPASDVVKLWSSNMTPVLLPGGAWTMGAFPGSVNIRWTRSANATANVTLTIETVDSIADLDNTSYEWRLYTRGDNASRFIVNYTNGRTLLSSNATGFVPRDISGNSTITAAGSNPTLRNALHVNVSKGLLGTIDVWNIDATTTQRGSVYTYQDYGWELPGNPGSAPPPVPPPSGLPSWLWIALALVIIAVLVAIVVAIRRRKPAPPPK